MRTHINIEHKIICVYFWTNVSKRIDIRNCSLFIYKFTFNVVDFELTLKSVPWTNQYWATRV